MAEDINKAGDSPEAGGGEWKLLGKVNDATSAGYAKETLESYDIPCAVLSESGFFGQAGLNLPQAYGSRLGQFEIFVPEDLKEEAIDIMNMILGDKWDRMIE